MHCVSSAWDFVRYHEPSGNFSFRTEIFKLESASLLATKQIEYLYEWKQFLFPFGEYRNMSNGHGRANGAIRARAEDKLAAMAVRMER
jgi:hypothetical protein